MNKEYFYPTISDLKNADCFNFDKWEWELLKGDEWVKVDGKFEFVFRYLCVTETFRYSLKQPKITHKFIMTSGEYWEVTPGVWASVIEYSSDINMYKLDEIYYELEWFQTTQHCKCPPEGKE